MIVKHIETQNKENKISDGQDEIEDSIGHDDDNITLTVNKQKYIEEHELESYANVKKFILLSHNIRSLKKKITHIMSLIGNASIDLMAL